MIPPAVVVTLVTTSPASIFVWRSVSFWVSSATFLFKLSMSGAKSFWQDTAPTSAAEIAALVRKNLNNLFINFGLMDK